MSLRGNHDDETKNRQGKGIWRHTFILVLLIRAHVKKYKMTTVTNLVTHGLGHVHVDNQAGSGAALAVVVPHLKGVNDHHEANTSRVFEARVSVHVLLVPRPVIDILSGQVHA